MHRALSARWLSGALRVGEAHVSTKVPLFLCPAISRSQAVVSRQATTLVQRRKLHIEAGGVDEQQAVKQPTTDQYSEGSIPSDTVAESSTETPATTPPAARRLPITCTGCGAFSQTKDSKQFGFYNLKTKRVRTWLKRETEQVDKPASEEEQVVNQALQAMSPEQLEELGLDPATMLHGELPDQEAPKNSPAPKSLVCDRCHTLEHNNFSDVEMFHPTVESLRETIEESPHKYNHIYHVIDAADFPMSLVPRLNVLLGDIRLRTKNRRSKKKFLDDRMIEMSFVITRSDLLGPTKESVDRLMPYLQRELRAALGRLGERVRLGNVSAVSAKRGWWTKDLKEKIWSRGGAAWMVGKVNVGKSQLFEAIYPKGRTGSATPSKGGEHAVSVFPREDDLRSWMAEVQDDEGGDLLPPLQPLRQYPDMPMVSSLPGTTASPIRIPFGNKKGELIDLPGLARSDLETYVRPEHRKSLIMKSRIIPEQQSLSGNKSLILGGGLIRITPRSEDLHFLMYNFTPLHDHLTSTAKAIQMQNQERNDRADAWTPGMENIGIDGLGQQMGHAGTFEVKHDVSKLRAGPLTRKDSINLSVDKLPFRVLSIDILIEGVGYVEIVCQVRRSYLEQSLAANIREARQKWESEEGKLEDKKTKLDTSTDAFAALELQRRDTMERPRRVESPQRAFDPNEVEPSWPLVDVFSPMGLHIGSRTPIQGWMRNKPLVKPEHKKMRPRKSAKGWKKRDKRERRAAAQAGDLE